MKYSMFFLVIILTFASCELSTPIRTLKVKQKKNIAILFIDRSISSFKGDIVEQKEIAFIASAIYSTIKNDQDEVWTSYIYGSTPIISNRKRWVFNPPVMDMDGLSRREIESEELMYEGTLATYKNQFVETILADIQGIPKDQMETDVFGCIRHIYDIQKKHRDSNIEVKLFSDMKHCKHIRSINCDGKNSFSSYAEANNFGADDARKIVEHYNLLSSPLDETSSVKIYLPAHDIDHDSGFEFLPTYYKQLFYNLGIHDVSFD